MPDRFEKTYTEEIKALEKVLKAKNSRVELAKMDSFYPAGDEQTMVYEVTGRVVPPAGIPLDVGCVVSNVATMLGISDAMEGKPFTEKYLTVTGEVRNPSVLHVPVGTSFEACIALAGGAKKSRVFYCIRRADDGRPDDHGGSQKCGGDKNDFRNSGAFGGLRHCTENADFPAAYV